MTTKVEDLGQTSEFVRGERRFFERSPSRFPAKFKDTREDFGTNVFLRNVSADGAKITTKERLYLNDSVTLEVELLDGKGSMSIRGEVVWTKKKDAELWDAGLRFYKVVFMDMWRFYQSAGTGSAV